MERRIGRLIMTNFDIGDRKKQAWKDAVKPELSALVFK
jgi:hypothetical protein